MYKIFMVMATSLGAITVAFGAFGAHKLKDLLQSNGRTDVFETAVKYQMFHTLALLALAIVIGRSANEKFLNYAGFSFLAGILIFSGSLYILSITNISKWGAVTPIGGLFLIAGWLFFLIGFLKLPS